MWLILDQDLNYKYFMDDAYYYLGISVNAAQTGIPSFDGIHKTNVFHPTWQCILLDAYWLGPVGKENFVAVAMLIDWCLLLVSVALFYCLTRLVLSPIGQASTTILWANPWVITKFWVSGMECEQHQLLDIAIG
jgi:hypothetical protein